MLSGGVTPRRTCLISLKLMLAAPTTLLQPRRAILYRGAGFNIVWPQMASITLIGGVSFARDEQVSEDAQPNGLMVWRVDFSVGMLCGQQRLMISRSSNVGTRWYRRRKSTSGAGFP